MRYVFAFIEKQYEEVCSHLFEGATTERAAFLLASRAQTTRTTTLLIRKVIAVREDEVDSASPHHLSIPSRIYLRALKEADAGGYSCLFVHSHPRDFPNFSPQDDAEEAALFRTAHVRVHHGELHGSIVFSSPTAAVGRVWLEDGTHPPVDRIRVVGNRLRYLFPGDLTEDVPVYFERQARAFTAALQPLLRRLHVGIVGVGGTGSAVCEQLTRLGIGQLTVIDDGLFEASNVNRVYGSSVFDEGNPKVNIAARQTASVGLGTIVHRVRGHLSFASVVRELVDVDVVFGCTDDQWGRSILNRLALWYHLPVIDMGVRIDATDGMVRSIHGRVTTLVAGAACLLCRGRISSDGIRDESLAATNPDEATRLRKEGYLGELEEPAPAVVTFTTIVAGTAVAELLNRITGFRGDDYRSTEVILLLDQNRVRTNSTAPRHDCLCSLTTNWGRGDSSRLLDLNWREEREG